MLVNIKNSFFWSHILNMHKAYTSFKTDKRYKNLFHFTAPTLSLRKETYKNNLIVHLILYSSDLQKYTYFLNKIASTLYFW